MYCLSSLLHLQITALKNLNLNIRKAALKPGSKASTLFVTDATTSEKVLKSSRLEEIRMTIINNMLYYHPVSFNPLACCRNNSSSSSQRSRVVHARADAWQRALDVLSCNQLGL